MMKMADDKTTLNTDKMPLSRFWACFFSCSIFAILWTNKIQKTRKWIPLFALFVTVWFVLDYILYPFADSETTLAESIDYSYYIYPNYHLESFVSGVIYDYFPDSGNLDDIIFLLSLALIVIYHLVIFVGSVLVMIYFMLKWVTEYNVKNYGYKSKREWKKANNPPRKIKENITKTAQKIKDVTKKTSEKIPSEKIKTTGVDVGNKIVDTAKNVKLHSKMSDEDKRKQIREWHDMMIMGVISESDFESKKAELLSEK